MKTRKKTRRRRDKMIKLAKPRSPWPVTDARYWDRSLPFFHASAGILLHRVANVLDFLRGGRVTHTAVHYLCGNSSFVRRGAEFVADPKKAGRLVCSFCEFRARQQRLPSADKLAGHHVHVGRLRVEQVCCRDHKERN
jgi:hypothetical protein